MTGKIELFCRIGFVIDKQLRRFLGETFLNLAPK